MNDMKVLFRKKSSVTGIPRGSELTKASAGAHEACYFVPRTVAASLRSPLPGSPAKAAGTQAGKVSKFPPLSMETWKLFGTWQRSEGGGSATRMAAVHSGRASQRERSLGRKDEPAHKLIRLEEVRVDHRLAGEGQVFKGQVSDAALIVAPQELGLAEHAGGGDGDVLEEDA